MKPTPQAIENAARTVRKQQFERTRRLNCYDPDIPLTENELADAAAALSCDLGDMVLVPIEPTEAMLVAATDLDEVVGGALYTAHPGSVYRAMIAAAEGER